MTDPLRPSTDEEPWTRAAIAFLDERIAHGRSCSECSESGWIGACGWNNVEAAPPRYTGAWLTAAIVAALVGVAVVIWRIVK